MKEITDIEKLKKQCKTRFVLSLVLLLVILLISVAISIVLIITSTEKFLLNLILSIVVMSLAAWCIILYFTLFYKQLAYLYRVTNKYSSFNVSELFFDIIEYKEVIKDKVTFKSIKVSYIDGGITYTRDLLLFNDIDLNVGSHVKGKLFNNFLIGVEVIDNENH